MRALLLSIVFTAAVLAVTANAEQAPPAQPQMTVAAAIGRLGDLDYKVRTRAAASLRRRPAPEVVPSLLEALERHTDGYVRYRVLVLLSAFNHPRIPDVMRQA